MATLFMEGWENYGTGELGDASLGTNDYAQSGGSSGTSVSSSSPRNGSQHLDLPNGRPFFRLFPNSGSSRDIGMHWATSNEDTASAQALTTNSFDSNLAGVGVADGGNETSDEHLMIVPQQGGTWILVRNGTTLATSSAFSQTTYVSHDVTFNGDTGAWSWQINGVQSFSGTTTVLPGGAAFDRLCLGIRGGSMHVDDVYIRDTDTHVGDVFVSYIFPASDVGSDQDYTLSTGSDASALIDETSPSDADFIEAATAGDTSTFNMTNPTEDIGAVFSVGIKTRALKSDAGASSQRANVVSSSSTANGTTRALAQTAVLYDDYFDLDPNGNIAWSDASIDALQVQFERTV